MHCSRTVRAARAQRWSPGRRGSAQSMHCQSRRIDGAQPARSIFKKRPSQGTKTANDERHKCDSTQTLTMSSRQREDRSELDRRGRRGADERSAGDRHNERRRTPPPRGSTDRAKEDRHDPKRRRLSPSDPDYRREKDRGDPPSRPHHRPSSPSNRHGSNGAQPMEPQAAGADRPKHDDSLRRHAASGSARQHGHNDRDRSRDHHHRDRDSGRHHDRDGVSGRRDRGSQQTRADSSRNRRGGRADAIAAEQEPWDAPAEAAAEVQQSTVHDYDYIVPTGGRHYEVRKDRMLTVPCIRPCLRVKTSCPTLSCLSL